MAAELVSSEASLLGSKTASFSLSLPTLSPLWLWSVA